ncbi:uncharacterized protein LOC136040596 [Artemia franciscana]|uniref:Uncharacterized protein n=1 Tax=Artemia franciscana TaxID=6661 RepID=A0AA88HNH9_ARTSF|nr:hypothetical protein QYM36_009422 [Artemia franciscana]
MDYEMHIKTEPECIIVEEDEIIFDRQIKKRTVYPPPPLIPISAYFNVKRAIAQETPPIFTPTLITTPESSEGEYERRSDESERRKRERKPNKSAIVRVVKNNDENEVVTSVTELLRNKIQERAEPVNLSTKQDNPLFPPEFLQTMEKLTCFNSLGSPNMLPQEFLYMMYQHLHGNVSEETSQKELLDDRVETPCDNKKRKRKTSLFLPPSKTPNEIAICKFKFTGGSKPCLKEKKMLSLDSGGKLRYYTGKDSKKQTQLEDKQIWNQVLGQSSSSCASLARCLGTSSNAVDTDTAPLPPSNPFSVAVMEPVAKTARQIMHEKSYRNKIEETIPIRQGDAELFSKFKISTKKPKKPLPYRKKL